MNHYQKKMDKDKINDLEKEATSLFGYTVAKRKYGRDNSKFTVDDKTKVIYPSLASVKGIGQAASEDIARLSTSGLDSFADIYLSIRGTKINKSVFSKLVDINYFSDFGTTKQLDEEMNIINSFTTPSGYKKTLKKSDYPDLNLPDSIVTDVTKSGKRSEKQWRIVDGEKLVKYLCSQVPQEEYPIAERCVKELRVLGYIDITDSTLDGRYSIVTSVNDKPYKPVVWLYCMNNGKNYSIRCKRSRWKDKSVKTTWKELPLQDEDFIVLKAWKKESKPIKVDGEWRDSDVMEFILTDYSLLRRYKVEDEKEKK